LYGALVGVFSGAGYLGLQFHHGETQPGVILFALPALHVVVGMMGGLLGMVIWKPPPSVPLATAAGPAAPPRHARGSQLLAGPIHFGRVSAGVLVVVAGVVWSSSILDYVLRASSGTLAISSHLQGRLIGWEIAALATLLGAGFAGATTYNGVKQGLCVGVG